ncbi:MAG: AEC family transporter [Solirubrobacterales bacterium]
MSTIVAALAPIFLLILLGWGVRATAFVPDAFWAPAEKLTYFVLFPALLVANLAEARLEGLPVAGMAAAQAGGILAMALAVALLRNPAGRRLDGASYSSLFQGAIRPNTYVGLAAAAGLWGAQGVTLTAICVALVVPLVNVLSVIALARWAAPAGSPPGWRPTMLALAKNPLIAACVVGIALNALGIGLPPIVGPFLKILASASLPLGLLAVGAGLDLRGLQGGHGAVAAAAALCAKHALLPAVAGLAALGLGVDGLPLAVCVLYAGLPVAPNSYVLARQLGGDARLMAAIITVSTLVAAVTLPVLAAAIAPFTLR